MAKESFWENVDKMIMVDSAELIALGKATVDDDGKIQITAKGCEDAIKILEKLSAEDGFLVIWFIKMLMGLLEP